MTDVYKPPYGTYTTPTRINPSARTQIMTNIDNLRNLIPDPNVTTAGAGTATTYMTDFIEIAPATAAKIRAELLAIYNGVSGAPTGSGI